VVTISGASQFSQARRAGGFLRVVHLGLAVVLDDVFRRRRCYGRCPAVCSMMLV
jgi:hypothetical protein